METTHGDFGMSVKQGFPPQIKFGGENVTNMYLFCIFLSTSPSTKKRPTEFKPNRRTLRPCQSLPAQ